MIATVLFYSVALTPLGLAAWLFFVVQPRDMRRFVETVRQQEREIVALEAAAAPPHGCTVVHGTEDVEACGPTCWLMQEDTERDLPENEGGRVLRHRDGSRDTLVSEGQVAS